MTREHPGLAGSPRAGGGGGTGLPQTRARHPPLGLRGFPAGRSPAAALGTGRPREPPPRGWCSARDTAFSRRGGGVTAVTPPPLPLATCGLSEPGEGAGAAESPEPGSADRPGDPLLRFRISSLPAPALSRH